MMQNQMSRGTLALGLVAMLASSQIAAAQSAQQTETVKTTVPTAVATGTSPTPACAPGNPIGGIIVKGAKNLDDLKKRCVPPETGKSISEQGVSATKSR